MSRVAYFNGDWVMEGELKVSAWDLATMQGASCFEMLRSFRHVHFKLQEHIDRLRQSCKLLNIPLPADFKDLENICRDVTLRNPLPSDQEHRLLIVVNAGCAPMYREIEGVIPHSYLYVATFPLRYTLKGFSKYFTEGVHCVTSKIRQVPDACVPSAAKHRSRLHFHLAQMQAPEGTWPLMMEQWPHSPPQYTEAPGANIMYCRDGRVLSREVGALPGISMQTVKELACGEEYHGMCSDLYDVDELWLTGTPFCMLPVVSLDGQPIGTGKPGPIYQQVLAKWSEMVGVDIAQQVMDWDSQG